MNEIRRLFLEKLINSNWVGKKLISLGFLALLAVIVFLLWSSLRWQKKAEENRIRADEQVWAERQLIQHINTDEKTKYINTTSFYYKVMGWYGFKPQYSKDGKFLKKTSTGMHRFTKVLLCQKAYEWEKIIGIPKFSFHGVGKIESNYNPICVGGINEEGWLQLHREAIGQALIFWNEMPKYLQAKWKFYYRSGKDMHDPINCMKVAACRFWGLNRLFGGNIMWIMSTYHWGLTRMWPLWKSSAIPKKIWKFYRLERDKNGVPKWELTSVRNPLMYYFLWYEIQSAWSSGRKDVNVETIDYMKRYMANSSKEKQNWIHSWRYNQQLLCVIADFKDKCVEKDKAYERMNTVALRAKKTYQKYYKDKDWKQAKHIFKRLIEGLKKKIKEK